MNRRTFNTTLFGGAVAMALPLPVPAKATSAVKTGPLYAWAVAITRAQNRASPALLAQQLGVSQTVAADLYASMLANGVVRAPLFGGLARAAKPLFKSGNIAAVKTFALSGPRAKIIDIKRGVETWVKRDLVEDKNEDQAT